MKLTYFDLRGRAEPIRFILAAAGVDYEDHRINGSQWAGLKSETPWGQIPILELDDGTIIAQSAAICRYLARTHNLAGSTDLEGAKCDEYVDAFIDVFTEWINFAFKETDVEKKAEKKRKFVEASCPNFFKKLNKILGKNGGTFLVGNTLTWADIFIGCCIEALEITADPNLLHQFPEVQSMRNAVLNNEKIKAWVDRRPAEDLLAILNSH